MVRSHLYEGGGGILGKRVPGKKELGWLKELKQTPHEWLGQPLGRVEGEGTRRIGRRW